MPKKATSARSRAQRNKPKAQKSFELVRPEKVVPETEESSTTTSASTSMADGQGQALPLREETKSSERASRLPPPEKKLRVQGEYQPLPPPKKKPRVRGEYQPLMGGGKPCLYEKDQSLKRRNIKISLPQKVPPHVLRHVDKRP